MQLTHDQVQRLDAKDVEKHYKRYHTYVGARTTETLIEIFLSSSHESAYIFRNLFQHVKRANLL